MIKIPLTQGKFALVDECDVALVSQFKWCLKSDGRGQVYAKTRICDPVTGKVSYPTMHRLLTSCPKGLQVDHADNNGLNNTRANLRIATHSENQRNKGVYKTSKTGFKGVFPKKTNQGKPRFVAQISDGTKQRYLGTFKTAEEANSVYQHFAALLHGNFTNTRS